MGYDSFLHGGVFFCCRNCLSCYRRSRSFYRTRHNHFLSTVRADCGELDLYQSGNLAILAVVIILLIFGLAISGTRKWFWFIRILAIYALAMILVFFGYLATANHQSILNNFNSQTITPLNYSAVVTNATASGWPQSVPSSLLTTAGAMIFIFFFMAAPISAYFAGEIKNTQRSMTIGLMGGTIMAWAIVAIGILGFSGSFWIYFHV